MEDDPLIRKNSVQNLDENSVQKDDNHEHVDIIAKHDKKQVNYDYYLLKLLAEIHTTVVKKDQIFSTGY